MPVRRRINQRRADKREKEARRAGCRQIVVTFLRDTELFRPDGTII